MLQTPCEQIEEKKSLLPMQENHSLDPADWAAFREQAHIMLDDILDYTKNIRQRPVWQPIPQQIREQLRKDMPTRPSDLAEVHREFMSCILPFSVGNVHPGFMGWVHGGGTPIGIVAEMLAAGLNANLGGRDQTPIEVERQVTRWMQSLFGFPETAAGLFVTGTSMANFIATVVARDAVLGSDVRKQGVSANPMRLTAYASESVHGCIAKAMDLCGLGSDTLRLVGGDARHRMDLGALEDAIKRDRQAGFRPFLIVGTAGTVDTGAIDDLAGLADLARREKLWFHVDGAYGALAMLAPEVAPKLRGIEYADSLGFDFHKWGQVPYDAGFLLVRDGSLQKNAFAAVSSYLRRESRGLAAGSPWPCDYGVDLSRGFRALKTWFTFKVYGSEAIGAAISRTCELARYLAERIVKEPELELLAPVELNIVCFRYRARHADQCNRSIVIDLQESGTVVPSTTTLDGRLAIRAAIVNHRTSEAEINQLIEATLAQGRKHSNRKTEAAKAAAKQDVPPSLEWEAQLKTVESQLEKDPNSIDLRFRRGLLLAALGRLVEARNDYIKVLERNPQHLAALNNLGSVLFATGYRKAARIAFHEAVVRHPADPASRVNYGNILLEESEQVIAHGKHEEGLTLKREASVHYQEALRINANDKKAHEGLSYVYSDLGDLEKAEHHRRAAFQGRSVMPMPYRGRGPALPVLLLASTTGGNVRLQKFLDEQVFQTFVVTPEFYESATPLPSHKLVINAIGDTELSAKALAAAQSMLAYTNAPVINAPSAVLATSRSEVAARLCKVHGAVTPTTVTLPREQLCAKGAVTTLERLGLEFPLLMRSPGFHTGLYFLRVETPESLPAAVAELPGPELIVMRYLDAKGPDGKTRKYRVMMIDGQLYPLHCAVSSHWKIHYFTAEMAENPEHRAEDAAFLENMPGVLGELGINALKGIQSVLGLDYGGIDFGLNANGEVLVFEANATMVVNPPETGERWQYRRPAYERIRSAIQNMFLRRAQSSRAASA